MKPELAHVYLALAGEAQQGTPGVALVDTVNTRTSYVLTRNLSPITFRQTIEDMIADDGNAFLYIVVRVESNMHVMKYSRAEAAKHDWSCMQAQMQSASMCSP